MVNVGQGGRLAGQRLQEAVQRRGVPLDLDPDGPGLVAHEAAKAQPLGKAVHKRPETDPLNDPADGDGTTFPHGNHYTSPAGKVFPSARAFFSIRP
jgi:hypothetical protein